MTEFGVALALIGALSLTVTKVVDLIRNVFDPSAKYRGSWIWNVTALVVGLAFALGWHLNTATTVAALIPALADKASALEGLSGEILTGFVVGMSAGFWHELLDALSGIASKDQAAATSR